MRAGLIVAVVLATSWLGCGGERVCEPGTAKKCVCPDATYSTQPCTEDGSGWWYCDCKPPETSVPPPLPRLLDAAPAGLRAAIEEAAELNETRKE